MKKILPALCFFSVLTLNSPAFSQQLLNLVAYQNSFVQEAETKYEKKRTLKHDWFYTSLEINYILLNTADLVTTFYSLDRGARESNPIAGLYIRNKPVAVLIKAGITGGVLLGLARVKKQNARTAYLTLGMLNLLYGYVVTNNIGVSLQVSR